MFVYNLSLGTNATIPVTLPGSYYNPSADGPWVAYQGATTGAFDDIWLYDTGNGQVTRVTNNAEPGDWNDWNPRVDGDRIVWEKDMLGSSPKPGIYLYNIAMGTRSLIIPGSEYRNPDIWEDWVVCVKNDRTLGVNGSQIILFNLLTKEERSIPMADGAITTGTMNNDGPCIDNGWVVWSSGDIWQAGGTDRSSSYQIYAYDIDSGQTIQITNNVAGNFSPSIEGNTVAWETKQPNAIMTYDIPSATIVQVSQVTVAGETVRSPDVDGDAIAWYSNRGLFYAVRGSQATTLPRRAGRSSLLHRHRRHGCPQDHRGLPERQLRAGRPGHPPAIRQDDRAHHGRERPHELHHHHERQVPVHRRAGDDLPDSG